ncbi:spermine/spermidine synthase superfamily protein [Desmospora sp. 8437]|nr:spermine/spermidine synthase superfamily protein [Desmospora sp. 8437]
MAEGSLILITQLLPLRKGVGGTDGESVFWQGEKEGEMPLSELPEVIERCQTPRGELQLQRRGRHFELISNGTFLMATYNGDSERALIRSALQNHYSPRRVLIGGLGVGFSLAEALLDPEVERVTVVEIEPLVIRWYREYFCQHSRNSLEDPRTRLIQADLVEWIGQAKESFDVISLDIDNGPDWTVVESNRGLYTENGIQRLKRLLAPDGIISFWSASPADAFKNRLESFFRVETIAVPHFSGSPDYLFLARA